MNTVPFVSHGGTYVHKYYLTKAPTSLAFKGDQQGDCKGIDNRNINDMAAPKAVIESDHESNEENETINWSIVEHTISHFVSLRLGS